ncbi:MAG: large conductance mechanosensitive channel protein MscL, partial [Alphaproteobacteria bacterium]
MLKEYREFIARGNVVDLAVGIIMGAAFTGIVNSLVRDVVMPPIGVLTGGVDFTDLYINMSGGSYPSLAAATQAGAATLNYGVFINTVINFVIVSIAVFFLVRAVNRLRRDQERPAATTTPPPPPPRSDQLLEEIRDLLK